MAILAGWTAKLFYELPINNIPKDIVDENYIEGMKEIASSRNYGYDWWTGKDLEYEGKIWILIPSTIYIVIRQGH